MHRKLALVVEDHLPNARLLAVLVERCGVRAEIAYNGVEALTMMQATKPDLVLLDLLMPIMTGDELLEIMQANADLSAIPVVIITTEEEAEKGNPYGLPYMRKPFNPADVQRIIREMLTGQPKAEDSSAQNL